MAADYRYACNCTDLNDGRPIHEMVEAAVDVTYRTVLKHCLGLLDWAVQQGYSRHPNQGLTLKADWAVSFHKSTFKGRPCYYVRWSAIEYIWVKEK